MSSPLTFSSLTLLLLFVLCRQLWALCYFPDGTIATDLQCDPNALVSACCERNSVCLSNGVCAETRNSSGVVNYVRGSCTDKSWGSLSCPLFCRQGTTFFLKWRMTSLIDGLTANLGGSAGVYLCDGKDHWCCDNGNVYQGCCSDSRNDLGLPVGTPVMTIAGNATAAPSDTSIPSLPSSTTAPSTMATVTAGTTSPATMGDPTTAMPASSKDLDLKIGAGVGIPLGIALLMALVYVAFLKTKRSRPEAVVKLQVDDNHTLAPQQCIIKVAELDPECRAQPELHAHAQVLPQLPDQP